MLIQSQAGYIELLPALPDSWKDGHFKGLCVRGGGVVDAFWKEGQIRQFTLTARADNLFRIKVPVGISQVLVNDKSADVEDGFIKVALKKGEEAKIEMKS